MNRSREKNVCASARSASSARGEQRPAGGHVEVGGRGDLAQRGDRATEQRGDRAAGVDVQRAAVGEDLAEVVVGAERVAPRQPVDEHRRLGPQERPHRAERLLVGAQHPVGRDDALRRAGRARREQDLRDRVRADGRERALDVAERFGRLEVGQRERAGRKVAGDDPRRDGVGDRLEGRAERGAVVGEHHPGRAPRRDRPDALVVAAEQGVGGADRDDGDARGEGAEQHQQVLDRVAREDHQRPLGAEAVLEQGLGDAVGAGPRRAPGDGLPARVLAPALGGEHAVGMRRGARAEEVRHARGDVPERRGGAQQERAAPGAAVEHDARRREHLGRGGHAALRAPRAGRPGRGRRSPRARLRSTSCTPGSATAR